jgi:hypothetical protein
MTTPTSPSRVAPGISLDTWAVVLAFAAALLVRIGVLKTVPW